MHKTSVSFVENVHPDDIALILWKFAWEMAKSMEVGNPGVPWPHLSEALREHWRQENRADGSSA
jgi:hypothetical protein